MSIGVKMDVFSTASRHDGGNQIYKIKILRKYGVGDEFKFWWMVRRFVLRSQRGIRV